MRTTLRFFSVLVTLIVTCSALAGQTTWTGTASSNWGAAGNWTGGVPTAFVDATIPAGTPNAPSTAGVAAPACRDLVVNAGATLTVAATSQLDVNRSLTVSGAVAGGGGVRFVGTLDSPLAGPGTIGANVEILKTGAGQCLLQGHSAISGNLTLTSGTFFCAHNGTFTMTVSGNAVMQGGVLTMINPGILDVAGNVTFSGTTIGTMPTVRCGGSFSANAAFAPTGGLLVFDGTGVQTLTSAGILPGVTVEATSTISTSTALTMNGTLTVNGSFTDTAATLVVNGGVTVNGTMSFAPGTLDLNGSLTVSPAGSLALGNATHTIAGNATVAGALTSGGTLVFDGAADAALASAATLPNVQIAKGSAQFFLQGNAPISGNLTLTSGTFFCAHNGTFNMTVSGNAFMQGGVLTMINPGILDVAGNVTFSGTTIGTMPTVRCGGSFSANAAFAPTGGLLVFDGTGVQTLASAGILPGVTVEATSTISTSTALTMNGTLTVDGSFTDTAATLLVNGGVTVNGTMSFSPGTLDLNGSLTVGSLGSLALGNATHTIAGNATVAGALTSGGTLVFDGAADAALASTATLPSVQIAKGSAQFFLQGNAPISGNLTLTSGTFFCAHNGTFNMTVSGNALMQGGVLTMINPGILDVAGNVTFSGTTIGTMPTVRCGGSFSANAAFAPTGGLLVFDGTGVQTLASAGILPGVTVEATSTISTSTALTMNGTLTVNGSFTDTAATLVVNGGVTVNGTMSFSPGTLDLNGSLTVASAGSLALGNATHTIAGNATVAGALASGGTLVFDGAADAALASTATLPSVQIAKGSAQFFLQGNAPIGGNLTLTSGTFFCAHNGTFNMTVSGNALMQGGVLTMINPGILDVAGNVTFSGTTIGTMPTVRCGGNWSSNAAFNPSAGTIELDGAGTTTVAHAAAGGTIPFPTLVISNGTRSVASDFTIRSSSITIAPTGALSVPGGRRLRVHDPSGATALDVNGALGVAANGELSLGPQTTATVGASGLLSLVGTAAQPAKVTGEAGGGYGLTVAGALAAKDFVVKEMGPAGMIVALGAAIAPAPNDFRNGTFDFRPGAAAGSVLLDLRRQAPAADFDGLVFLNTPNATGVFNVKTAPASEPVSLTNWTGAFAGPAFENDPSGLIAWNLQPKPPLNLFVVVPGAELAKVVWGAPSQANVASWQIRRATTAAGPFSVLATVPLAGPTYAFQDSPLAANVPVHYALYAQMTGGELLLMGGGSATPYSAATPGNVKKVGGNGAFATIQAAINAATDPNSIVWVTPGTYASFTIGATAVPSNLRILGDDSGPVNIATTNGPIVIQNVPGSSGVELSNLIVGSATSAQNGIVIANCASPVVLDEVDVFCDAGHTAISVSASPATAIQRSDIAGGTGVAVTSGSYVSIGRGSLTSLVSTGSTVEISTLTPGSINVTPPSSLITRTGLMPEISLPEFIKLSQPSALFLHAQPNAPFVIGASPRLGFESGTFEMPYLLDNAGLAQLNTMFTDGQGNAAVGFEVAPLASLLGFSFTVQVVVGDPVSGNPCLSNVESMVCIP